MSAIVYERQKFVLQVGARPGAAATCRRAPAYLQTNMTKRSLELADDRFDEDIREKIFYFSFSVTLTFDLSTLNLFP